MTGVLTINPLGQEQSQAFITEAELTIQLLIHRQIFPLGGNFFLPGGVRWLPWIKPSVPVRELLPGWLYLWKKSPKSHEKTW